MKDTDTIHALRRKAEALEEDAVKLAETMPPQGAIAMDLVAMELHDLDRSLYQAAFLRNDAEIRRLIQEIEAATSGAQALAARFQQLGSAVKKARRAVQGLTADFPRVEGVLDEIEEMIELATGAK